MCIMVFFIINLCHLCLTFISCEQTSQSNCQLGHKIWDRCKNHFTPTLCTSCDCFRWEWKNQVFPSFLDPFSDGLCSWTSMSGSFCYSLLGYFFFFFFFWLSMSMKQIEVLGFVISNSYFWSGSFKWIVMWIFMHH